MAKNDNLKDFLTDVADAIREKKGTTDAINPQDFSSEIASIEGDGDIWGFDEIGYTPQNFSFDEFKSLTKQLELDYNSGRISTFENKSIVLAPNINTSNKTSISSLFDGCSCMIGYLPLDTHNVESMAATFRRCYALAKINDMNTSKVTTMINIFNNCSRIRSIPNTITTENVTDLGGFIYMCPLIEEIHELDTRKVTSFQNSFTGCTSLKVIPHLDFDSITNMTTPFSSCSKLVFMSIHNIGKSSLESYNFSDATNWGVGSKENRQSLIDSLITYSYDRASNGMSTATIKLSANTKALLTEEEIAQITNKGFTIS